jgi:hypothetical protein
MDLLDTLSALTAWAVGVLLFAIVILLLLIIGVQSV